MPESKRLQTKLIHAGEPRHDGAVTVPVYQSAMFLYAGETSYHDLKYIRLNNTPNHRSVAEKLAVLENGEAAMVAASGMAAITTSLFAVLKSGDHLLAQDCLYGGTHDLITQDFPSFGITVDFIDGGKPETWESKLRPETKAVYMESMSNPLLQVADLQAAADFAKKYKLISLIDNTFPSPYNFRPLDLGFDVVLHSCTKYLNGHSDIVGGAAIGAADIIDRITHKLNHFGGSMDPHTCFLLQRGMKTLAVRVRQQNENALQLAHFLEKHERVTQVNYPGLESHPDHGRAKALFDGFSGMMSFELEGGRAAAEQVIGKLTLPLVAPSLGGVETLVTRPAITSHAGMSKSDRERIGITDGLVRVSVGIEAVEDLIADFGQALA